MGNSCEKILQEILKREITCGKFIVGNYLLGNSFRGKSEREILDGTYIAGSWLRDNGLQKCILYGKISAGNYCWENRLESAYSLIWEILVGRSCGKILVGTFLWENLAINSCGKILTGK